MKGAMAKILKDEQERSKASSGGQGGSSSMPHTSGLSLGAQSNPAGAQTFFPQRGPASLAPACLRPWKYADRADFEFDHVDQLAESFGKEGQLQPAIVRPVKSDDPDIKYEIIAGRARWLSAKKAGTKLDVVIRPNLTDEEAFRIMVQENESRRNLSDYSKGKRFRRALDDALYTSQAAMAKAFNLSDATMTRLLATAALDERIVKAFSSPAAIGQMLGIALKRAEEAGLTNHIVRDAKLIEAGAIRVADIPGAWTGEAVAPRHAAETSKARGAEGKERRQAETQKFFSEKGAPLFVVKSREGQFPVVKFKVPVDAQLLEEIKALVDKRTRRRRA